MANFGGFSPYTDIQAKTSAYTVKPNQNGVLFTTRGATADVAFTLPATANLVAGWECSFYSAADVELSVVAETADTITVLNNLTADSVQFTTANEHIGGAFRFVWDGTGWLCFVGGAGGHVQTLTVTDS